MDRAQGKYIYFLDSDDMITPNALEELFLLAERDDLRGVFFDSQVIYENEALEKRYSSYLAARNGAYPDRVQTGAELFDRFIRQDEWTCYVQRQFWDLDFLRRNGIRFPDGVEHEDELLPFEGLLLADRVRYVKKDYFIRRYREDSVMTTPPTAKNFHGYFMNFCKMDDFCRSHRIESFAAERNMYRMYQLFSRYYGELKDREDLSAWFRPEELPLYRFYDRLRVVEDFPDIPDETLLDALKKARAVYVYGAGIRGKKAIRCITAAGLAVDGVVVTSMEGNPAVVMGHRVTALKDLRADREGTVILLAMARGFAEEVRPGLENAGWKCLYFS